jgi:hypothetical protein
MTHNPYEPGDASEERTMALLLPAQWRARKAARLRELEERLQALEAPDTSTPCSPQDLEMRKRATQTIRDTIAAYAPMAPRYIAHFTPGRSAEEVSADLGACGFLVTRRYREFPFVAVGYVGTDEAFADACAAVRQRGMELEDDVVYKASTPR